MWFGKDVNYSLGCSQQTGCFQDCSSVMLE